VPLIPPSLDDRSFDDLVQEIVASVPAHTPEWTNPLPGDPGRTLIELFSWLADTILYRANLIPEKQHLAFLRLLGQSMQPAAAATGILSLSLDSSATAPVAMLAGAKAASGPTQFETLGELNLLPLTAQAYIKAPLSADQKSSSMSLLSGLQKLYNLQTLPTGYTTTPIFSNGQSDDTGIDLQSSTTDNSIWLALLAGKKENRKAIVDAIGGQNKQQLLNVGVVPSLFVPGLFSDVGPPAAIQCTWQMSSDAGTYTTLKVVDDTTLGLTQTGIVRLMVPEATVIGAPPNDVRNDPRAGVGLRPPRIDDPAIADRLITWVRLTTTSSLKLSWFGANAVQIDQRTTFQSIVIGVSDGTPGQVFSLAQNQVDPATFQLEVDMPGFGYQLWQQVDDLAILQGPAPAFVLDPEAGTVTFGNQLQGMIVPIGRRIRVRQMRAGGGAAGNLPAGSLSTIQALNPMGVPISQTITVQQPIATRGGVDAETLDHAEQRIPSLLKHQDRAVTAGDYTSLAESVPGADIARVEVLPLFKPQTRTPNVPGVVSVMVIPGKQGVQNPCPRADRPLLETVYQYLNPRRPATAEMYVISSEYVGLGISVSVEVKTGFGLLQVSQAVETALRAYLWPIAPGGTDNTGWTLGRHVRSLELEVIVSQVPGVIEVDGLNLFTHLSNGTYQQIKPDASGRSELDMQSWQLPEVLQVIVIASEDGTVVDAPTTLAASANNDTDNSVAVPVVPAVC
jgi:predicted phage baseplate assembly protein